MRIEAVKFEGLQPVNVSVLKTDDVVALVQSEPFTWVDIDISRTSEETLRELLVSKLDFHPATVEDCFSQTPYHQPKIDEEPAYKFITFIYFEQVPGEELAVRELNLFLGSNYVITVHRHALGPVLTAVRKMPRHIIENESHAVLFAHHVLDVLADTFLGILKEIQRTVDELELSVLRSRTQRMISLNPFRREEHLTDMRRILRSRQSIVMLRKTLATARGIIDKLIEDYDYEGTTEASQEIAIYFRDIHDHMGKYLEIVESEDGALTHLMEVQHLVSNYRTNEIIVVLTVLSAIMLPLNLIVGFFGMNFDQFHFYHTAWGIWVVSLSMVGLSAGLIAYFRAKGWL